jgi:hypothetical protein
MSTSGNSFELILEEVMKQKRVLEEMQAENEALRQQLAELRAGKGISIEIEGQRYLLNFEDHASSPDVVSELATKEVPAPAPEVGPSLPAEPVSDGAEATAATAAIQNETPAPALRDSSDDFLLEEVSDSGSPFPATASSFLEEAMLEEFANASTRQMNVWAGPITNHPTLDEREKATLRRELMGSFLLE